MKHSEQWWMHKCDMSYADGYRVGRNSAIKEYEEKNCICKGNWRSLVKECDPLIGKKFVYEGKVYTFFGLVHGADDYYYGLCDKDYVCHLFSCVGNLKSYGFVPFEEVKDERSQLADRITNYLETGGFFNPEAMEHDKVRDLLIDVRKFIE